MANWIEMLNGRDLLLLLEYSEEPKNWIHLHLMQFYIAFINRKKTDKVVYIISDSSASTPPRLQCDKLNINLSTEDSFKLH